jgi:plasmid stability protein
VAQLNLRNFPDDVHRDLKVTAAQLGKTMQEFITETLQAAVAKPPRKKSV